MMLDLKNRWTPNCNGKLTDSQYDELHRMCHRCTRSGCAGLGAPADLSTERMREYAFDLVTDRIAFGDWTYERALRNVSDAI